MGPRAVPVTAFIRSRDRSVFPRRGAGPAVLRLIGLRELASGLGALSPAAAPAVLLSVRVVGDVRDLAPRALYRYGRDCTNLARFMRYVEAVQVTGERRSRWTATTPAA